VSCIARCSRAAQAGRQLIVAGDIPNARLVLQQVADDNATAALELGATYDPIELEKLLANRPISETTSVGYIERKALPDIAMARTWYQKAKELGSTEAAARLERLAGREGQSR
jgi:TPR repeat protein